MTKYQGDKLNMYGSVINHNQKNAKVTEPLTALQNSFIALGALKAAIDSTATQQAVSQKGHTTTKADNKKNLAEFGNQVAGATFAWAALANKPVIFEQVRITESELAKMRDEKVGKLCMRYYEIATENLTELANFGITKEVLDAFKQEIDQYEAVVPAPRNAQAEKTRYKNNLAELFKKGDFILKSQIDKLVLQLKKTNPNYYMEYKTNRRIVSSSSTSTALAITVKDAATNLPIVGASIMLDAIKWEALTDKQGQATAKPVPLGFYSATIKKEGYETQTINELKTILGKTQVKEVTLNKIG